MFHGARDFAIHKKLEHACAPASAPMTECLPVRYQSYR